MQAIDLLLQRRSAKTLTEPGPDEGALELLLASAARAPDHGRLRPWRFVVIRGAARQRFGALLAAQLQRVRPQSTAETLEREQQKAFRAPLIIAVGAVKDAQASVPMIEQVLCAAAAAQNILLAAYALGFNGVWKTGAAAYDETLKRELGFQAADALVGYLYIGTEVDAPPAERVDPDRWRERVSYLSE